MLRMSCCDHFLSVVRPLTFSNDFSSEATEPILLKFHMEPRTLGKLKIAKMVAVHLTKMSVMLIYGKNPLKIFSRTEDALGLYLCTTHRGREVYQSFAKIVVVH